MGVMYSVEHVAEDTVTLWMLPEYRANVDPARAEVTQADTETAESEETHGDETADVQSATEEVAIPLQEVPAVTRLTHAMCYYTVPRHWPQALLEARAHCGPVPRREWKSCAHSHGR